MLQTWRVCCTGSADLTPQRLASRGFRTVRNADGLERISRLGRGLSDAELVAFRVGHGDPRMRPLTAGVEDRGAPGDETVA